MKLIATPDSLKIVDMPLQAKPNQYLMVQAAMELAMEAPIKIIGNTMIVDDNRKNKKEQKYDDA